MSLKRELLADVSSVDISFRIIFSFSFQSCLGIFRRTGYECFVLVGTYRYNVFKDRVDKCRKVIGFVITNFTLRENIRLPS